MTRSSTALSPVEPAEACARGRRKAQRRARPWHRVLGLLSAIPLVWVVITGALLNHTVDWKLDRIMIQSPWVLKAYGMNPDGKPVGIEVAGRRVVEWDQLIFVDGEVRDVRGKLLGALPDGAGLAVVTDMQVMRIESGGETLEVLDGASLPGLPLTGVSPDAGGPWLANADGWHRVGEDWLEFESADRALESQTLTPSNDRAELDELRNAWSQGGLPLSRVLLDLHAGHFLGPLAKYFYDFVALATVWLCVTGVILFFRKPRRRLES